MDVTNKPKVSMIIVSYNEKEYLPRAIQSCLCQKYENKEIIVGDDGSSDGSIELIKSYDSIKYFVMKRTQEKRSIIPSIRVSNVIKNALDFATGDYVVLLSGDDYFCDDNILDKAVSFLEENSKYSAYVYSFKYVGSNYKDVNVLVKGYIPWLYWSGDYIHISCFVFRRINSKDLLSMFCDDIGLEYVLATKGKWKYDEKVVFAYFQRENSIMHNADKVELALLETLLFQDIKCWKGKSSAILKLATYAKLYSRIIYLRKNSDRLNSEYSKYIKKFNHTTINIFDKQNYVFTWIEFCFLAVLKSFFWGLRLAAYLPNYLKRKIRN